MLFAVSVQAASGTEISPENYSVYMKSITTGEVIVVPVEETALDVQVKRGGLTTKSEASVANGVSALRATDWTAYAEANWMNNGGKSWVYSYTNKLIESMSAQNESYYSSGNSAGSDLNISPSGWSVGAISAYVTARAGFTLREVYGFHSYYDSGYSQIRLETYNLNPKGFFILCVSKQSSIQILTLKPNQTLMSGWKRAANAYMYVL